LEGATYFTRFCSGSTVSLFVVVDGKSLVDCTVKVLLTSPLTPVDINFFGALSNYLDPKNYRLPLVFTTGFVLTSDLLARPLADRNGCSSYSARLRACA
jgi:hypothetical protein